MVTPILATKLYIPPPRPKAVSRPRLIERLNEGLYRKMTLITAPAGYGKTTLLSEWIRQSECCVTWLSLDEGDNDPVRFWAYFIAALQMLDMDIGRNALALMQSPMLPPMETILTTLLNEIAAFPDDFAVVLDDYHVIDAGPIAQALTFLIEHLPPHMHLFIATREDPNLPLARLRARNELIEIRAANLRLTSTEAGAFLNQVMDLALSDEEVAALESRTEGWVAGLQLAALAVQGTRSTPGRENVRAFIEAFAGDNRYIVDYLVEEVLQRQSERVRSFLLQTSILNRLCGPLCNAVTEQGESTELLEALERGNLFVSPLDDKRYWFRYHHLFADVLRVHLMEEQPDQVSTLHRRASEWYEHEGLTAAAIRHALAAEDFVRAADLVELAWPAMRRNRQEAAMLGWLKALPDPLIRRRPVLSVVYAHALLAVGEVDDVDDRLRDAERWLDTTANMSERPQALPAKMVVVDGEAFRRLPGAIAVARAGKAMALGHVPETVKYARRALDLVPEEDHLQRGAAAALLGLASWASGDLEAAHRAYAAGMARLQRAGNITDAIGGAIALADIRIAQGRLREAMSTYERGLQLATEQGEPLPRGTADMYVGMSELYRERDDLNAATRHLLRSKELGEHTGLPQNRYRWRVAMARLRQARGNLDEALDLLHEAERLYVSDFFPQVRPIAALKTRVWVAQGRLGEALGWAREQGLSAHDDLSYLREFEHVTLARVFLACYRSDRADHTILEALGLLKRLLQAAEEGERSRSVIEILVLQALAHQMYGDNPAALGSLERALTLAEPEGYVRMFVDEGPPMALLLQEAAKHRIAGNYVRQLLAAFNKAGDITPAAQLFSDPLTERERDVLRLLQTDLNGPQIARELTVSLNTVRTHTKNIFKKLGVNSRRAALRRAEELDLL